MYITPAMITNKLPIVGVMGSGTELLTELTTPLGQALGELPVNLLTGGGYGVMRSVMESFTSVADRKGHTIGIIPYKLLDGKFVPQSDSYPNRFVEVAVAMPLGVYDPQNPDRITRNHTNILTSDAVIILPGGKGTKNEAELALQFNKSAICYGPERRFEYIDSRLPRTESVDEAINFVKAALNLN